MEIKYSWTNVRKSNRSMAHTGVITVEWLILTPGTLAFTASPPPLNWGPLTYPHLLTFRNRLPASPSSHELYHPVGPSHEIYLPAAHTFVTRDLPPILAGRACIPQRRDEGITAVTRDLPPITQTVEQMFRLECRLATTPPSFTVFNSL
jgi:hypothetical protein